MENGGTDWNEAIRELPYVMPAVSESSKREAYARTRFEREPGYLIGTFPRV